MSELTLRCGKWEAQVRPTIGGSIAALRHGGLDILRPAAADASDPLAMACFPMVPWCNRVRDARFAWRGRDIALPVNFAPEPHSIHGLGWQREWQCEPQTEAECALTLEHAGDTEWPWAWRAMQHIRLTPAGCTVALTATNLSADPMPVGLGLHPYFRRRPDTRVRFRSKRVLLTGADGLPSGERASGEHFACWSQGAPMPATIVDHCHAGWGGEVTISDALGTVAMAASGAPHLHLYAPADGTTLCCEPVGHLPDALNTAPGGVTVLAPGNTAALTMRIAIA